MHISNERHQYGKELMIYIMSESRTLDAASLHLEVYELKNIGSLTHTHPKYKENIVFICMVWTMFQLPPVHSKSRMPFLS